MDVNFNMIKQNCIKSVTQNIREASLQSMLRQSREIDGYYILVLQLNVPIVKSSISMVIGYTRQVQMMHLDGRLVCSWLSESEGHRVSGLPVVKILCKMQTSLKSVSCSTPDQISQFRASEMSSNCLRPVYYSCKVKHFLRAFRAARLALAYTCKQ